MYQINAVVCYTNYCNRTEDLQLFFFLPFWLDQVLAGTGMHACAWNFVADIVLLIHPHGNGITTNMNNQCRQHVDQWEHGTYCWAVHSFY